MKISLIRTEEFTDENGNKMIREYYGTDETHITHSVEMPVQKEIENLEEPEIEEVMSQDEINAEILLNQMTIIAKLEEIGNV